ncbi:MAG: OmpA family protein [Akkermansiaceae bacterium]|nr:OmpA family protein [Akkermansiaceae bacterium]
MKFTMFSALVAALVFPLSAQVDPQFKKDASGSKDHPLLKRIEGSVILKYSTKKFDAFTIALEKVVFDYRSKKFKDWKKLTVEGARTTLFYREPDDAGTLECIRAYQNDLKSRGFEVLFEGTSNGKPTDDSNQLDNGYGRFIKQVYTSETDYRLQQYTLASCDDFRYTAMKKPATGDSGDIYVSIFCGAVTKSWKEPKLGIAQGTVIARVDVLETKAIANRMVTVKADEMQQQINAAGRVALYGILFDFNKTDIKPESDVTLQEISKLLAADPALKLLVVGHTDNAGSFELNRDLSKRRAASVVEALAVRFNVSKQRLFPFGCSFASPVAPNTSEEGRAKNRRVELVKWN